MKVYLVGGAVRDRLLGRKIKEKDWVVVGSSEQEMKKLGYKQVGRDFPVFLHPQTQEEYALARTERKKGQGYGGFEVYTGEEVSLEEDLLRRDLTINAMAENEQGVLIDPYLGERDLENKILRHISPAFTEDPLRVLRLARFYATFSDFKVADETIKLAIDMVGSGELSALTYERVWLEWQKVLGTQEPWKFVEFLIDVGAWSEVMVGFDMPQQDLAVLKNIKNDFRGEALFALLGQYMALNELKTTLGRWPIAKKIKDLAILYHEFCTFFEIWCEKKSSSELLKKLYRWDLFRRKERFLEVLKLAKISLGRQHQLAEIEKAAIELEKFKPKLNGVSGLAAKENIAKQRLEALNQILAQIQ